MNQKIRHGSTEHRSVHILETLTRLNLAHAYSPLRPLVAPVAEGSIENAVIAEIPHVARHRLAKREFNARRSACGPGVIARYVRDLSGLAGSEAPAEAS